MAAIGHPFGNPLTSQLELIRRIVSSDNPGVEINHMYAFGGDYVEFSIKKGGKRHEMKFTGTYLASASAYEVAEQIQTTIGLWRQEYPM